VSTRVDALLAGEIARAVVPVLQAVASALAAGEGAPEVRLAALDGSVFLTAKAAGKLLKVRVSVEDL